MTEITIDLQMIAMMLPTVAVRVPVRPPLAPPIIILAYADAAAPAGC